MQLKIANMIKGSLKREYVIFVASYKAGFVCWTQLPVSI